MIAKVQRGRGAGRLLRYLFGPGQANEHTDPHVVASYAGGPESSAFLEPPTRPNGRRDVSELGERLTDLDLLTGSRKQAKPVWHVSVRAAPEDRRLTGDEWSQIATDMVTRAGLVDELGTGCRWVAVRHADDHIHIAAFLVGLDGRAVAARGDYYRVGEACRAAEARYGLRTTAPRNRTGDRQPTRAETEKAARAGSAIPARVTLRRSVEAAATSAAGEGEFFAALRKAGVEVRLRYSSVDPKTVTGYAVALPGDLTAEGKPVWYGGGRLAQHLTLPQLRARWAETPGAPDPGGPEPAAIRQLGVAFPGRAQRRALAAAAKAATDATDSPPDPAAAAAAGALAAAARAGEHGRPGPLTTAAEQLTRAGRTPWHRPAPATPLSRALRAAARDLNGLGRLHHDDRDADWLRLLAALADLAAAIVVWREAAGQHEQARAAAAAAATFARHSAAPSPARSGPLTAGLAGPARPRPSREQQRQAAR
ncbi:relaxase [Frankia sp. B2]|uniref:relaxase/mobilization nuclease domain-containing protein n=1 Tax=unclassified Frankia TaxID=2632575 RepID=UPI000872ED25|nr:MULTISPECIES: hypothetical protein [unclassified Frankia]OFB39885.1 hypothetical protein Manayef4_20040 [Frankia sp. CgIM4]TFE32123.1 relaxase [Frankia sp. B2]